MVDVSDVLRDRMREMPGIERMVVVSVLVHASAVAAAVLAPASWLPHQSAEPRTVMTISLGSGPAGAQNGGLTTIGGRPVQAETPPDTKPEPVRPPAAKAPEMTVPSPRGATKTGANVKDAPRDSRGRKPTRGAEPVAGSSVADTGVRGQGFGLSAGGGAGGTGVRLDVGNFCCPDYLVTMTQRIQQNWNPHAESVGDVIVRFTIARDGGIGNVQLERSSGYTALDLGAQRALVATRQLPPLPPGYPNPDLTIHLTFQYR